MTKTRLQKNYECSKKKRPEEKSSGRFVLNSNNTRILDNRWFEDRVSYIFQHKPHLLQNLRGHVNR